MDGINNIIRIFQAWWQFFDYCFNVNPAAQLCGPFWGWIIAAFVAAGALAVLVGVGKYLRHRRQYFAALRAQWERESIDEVGIKEAQWNADKAYQAEVPEEELLARIKAAVEQRRADSSAGNPGAKA